MLLRQRTLPVAFIEPCQPALAKEPPSGPGWIHEIKHDGYRLMVRRDGAGIRLITKNGYDWSARYPLVVEAVNALRCRSCVIDGEAVWCGEDGVAVFEGLRSRGAGKRVFLRAFDLLELNGKDLRDLPIQHRKGELGRLLHHRMRHPGLEFNDHITEAGDVVFRHACAMGLEGIVSKRLGSPYRSGRSKDWVKIKNPAAPAMTREWEEDWNGRRGAGAKPPSGDRR
jgi:bifunctional non-homologous end joining protein LigD